MCCPLCYQAKLRYLSHCDVVLYQTLGPAGKKLLKKGAANTKKAAKKPEEKKVSPDRLDQQMDNCECPLLIITVCCLIEFCCFRLV
jgi:hypothetical protein